MYSEGMEIILAGHVGLMLWACGFIAVVWRLLNEREERNNG